MFEYFSLQSIRHHQVFQLSHKVRRHVSLKSVIRLWCNANQLESRHRKSIGWRMENAWKWINATHSLTVSLNINSFFGSFLFFFVKKLWKTWCYWHQSIYMCDIFSQLVKMFFCPSYERKPTSCNRILINYPLAINFIHGNLFN